MTHKIKFVSPQIEHVAAQFASFLFPTGQQPMAARSAITPYWLLDTAGKRVCPLPDPEVLDVHAECSFITGFFPKPVQSSLDSSVGVFGIPARDGWRNEPHRRWR